MFASSIRRATARLVKFPSVVIGCHVSAKESRQTVMAVCYRRPAHLANRLEKGYACRLFSAMPDDQLNKRVDAFQSLFVEARMCIEDMVDAAETTYFDEDAETAKEAVAAAVDEFKSIINDIEDADQKNRVMRSNGLKVEQLKGELEMAIKGGH
mmetsp:Transcript_19503/g.25146  ORF Transcript_19503/g.25146 Transcript_19503/m.25146 type:complete len:154 (-) Transcript_19503:201-662(-)|eukprot:CAMPEP_0198143102 /NCGR_PEP_ID=MMETSP1443-20131203/5787_1 /TAXON_ID=186043 /ORGANISM="Entomoneis sp., Strain CCMP2396" /LENGTH=153 /DNA_ID=CAMNT_0043806245 /DNA_START=63 /DNA_END=524 /DNA_ORIENTATION=+